MDRKEIENSLAYKASKSAIDWYQTHQKADVVEGFEEGYKQGYEQGQKDAIKKAIDWVKWNNNNGGCNFDGWERNLIKDIRQ